MSINLNAFSPVNTVRYVTDTGERDKPSLGEAATGLVGAAVGVAAAVTSVRLGRALLRPAKPDVWALMSQGKMNPPTGVDYVRRPKMPPREYWGLNGEKTSQPVRKPGSKIPDETARSMYIRGFKDPKDQWRAYNQYAKSDRKRGIA